MVAQWDSGTIGMLNHNLGSYQDHVKALGVDKFRGIPQPDVGPDGKRVQVSNPVDGLGLFKSSKNKDGRLEVHRVRDLARGELQVQRVRGADAVQQRRRARTRGSTKAEPTKLAAEALSDGSTTIVQLPYYLPDWNTISKTDNEPNFQKVLLGTMSAKDFLDTLAEQLNEAQAEWNGSSR